jgi:hypothetical protein
MKTSLNKTWHANASLLKLVNNVSLYGETRKTKTLLVVGIAYMVTPHTSVESDTELIDDDILL